MKRKAPLHGKKESAEMPTGAAADFESFEKRAEKRDKSPDTKSSQKIAELRNKVKSGFYESTEVIKAIVSKLLIDIKQPKE